VSHAVKYGVLVGLVSSAYMFLMQILGQITNPWLSAAAMLFWIAGIVLAQLSYRKANQGIMGYGMGVLLGIVVTAISVPISRAYVYIHLKFISTELLDYTMDRQALAYEQYGLGPEEIDRALAGWTYTIPGFVLLGLVISLLMGVILSLIIAAITRKSA
jgi:hypothetical protein